MTTRTSVSILVGMGLSSLLVAGASAQSAFTATYDFTGIVANSGGNTDPTPPPVVADLTLSSFTSTGAAANPNAGGRFSFPSQPLGGVAASDDFAQFTGSLNLTVYFEVTLTPLAAIELQIDSISFAMRRSGTGVRSYAVRSSVDSFTANLPALINPANPLLGVGPDNDLRWLFDSTSNTADQNGSQVNPGASHASLTTPVTFRFYGWNADATGGTFSIDNVTFTGTTRGAVPEPTVATLLTLGLAAWGLSRRRCSTK